MLGHFEALKHSSFDVIVDENVLDGMARGVSGWVWAVRSMLDLGSSLLQHVINR